MVQSNYTVAPASVWGRRCVHTELLPRGLEGPRMGTPTDVLPHVNLEVRKKVRRRISVYQVSCLWVLSSSRHFAFFISLHFHNKPMRIIGSMILQVRKLRLTEVTCLQKYTFCVKEEKRRGKNKVKNKFAYKSKHSALNFKLQFFNNKIQK